MAKKKNSEVMRLMVSEGEDCCDILVYGQIGGQDSYYAAPNEQNLFAQVVADACKRCDQVNIRINSPGGSVFQADGMAAIIRQNADKISCYADGVVASCAVDLLMAVPVERRFAARNAKIMVHCSSGVCAGTAKDMTEMANALSVFDQALAESLANAMQKTPEEITATYLDGKDHWFTAKQAIDAGFIGAIQDFEAENMPADVETMDVEQLSKFYVMREQEGKEKPSFFDKIKRAFTVVDTPILKGPDDVDDDISNLQKNEEMNKEAIETAVREGKVSVSDLETLVAQAKANEPVTVARMAEVIAESQKPLLEEIKRLTAANGGLGVIQTAGTDPVVDAVPNAEMEILRKAGADLRKFLN